MDNQKNNNQKDIFHSLSKFSNEIGNAMGSLKDGLNTERSLISLEINAKKMMTAIQEYRKKLIAN